MQQQNPNQRPSDRRGEFCGCVKYCGCQASLFPRKPIADRFCICRERGGFTYPQEQSRRKEAADSGGDRCGEGSYTPENRTDAADTAHPKPIQWSVATLHRIVLTRPTRRTPNRSSKRPAGTWNKAYVQL